MMHLISIFPFSALLAIAVIHFYWAFGGKKGFREALPEIENTGKKAFLPSPFLTFLVACIFVGMAVLIGQRGGLFSMQVLDNQWFTFAARGIGIVFLVRAIGDFRYCGFFKTVKKTRFAELDSRFYSPLSAAIGTAILVVEFF